MNKKVETAKFILADILSAAVAWAMFYFFRKAYLEPRQFGVEIPITVDRNFYKGIILIPLFWVALYQFAGSYSNVFRKSRLKEFQQTFGLSFIGAIVLFFSILLDDQIGSSQNLLLSFIALFFIHFTLTSSFRFYLSSIIANHVHSRKIGFNTLIIGSNKKALELYEDIEGQSLSTGNRFVGFLHVDETNGHLLREKLPHLGGYEEVKAIIQSYQIEEVIIAIESSEHESIGRIVTELEDCSVIIKIIPDMYDILSGCVKMSSIFGAPLIEISNDIMPQWQKALKRFLDVFISLFVLIVFAPFFIAIAIIVKSTSKGPAFYSHERIGWHGKPFTIYKYRSMYADAEKNGPALSSKDDNRITPFGRFMRRTRLDEIPQFYNVLIGDMSLVGPRPERQYFIDQIMKVAPHYKHLHKVRPGITSWGQVKFGYAENVEQMVERLKYDVIYIENMSLMVDLRILIYTVLIVFQGRGK